MGDLKLGAVESRFADIIWEHEPLTSTELVKLAAQALNWKKSTTYTCSSACVIAAYFKIRVAP